MRLVSFFLILSLLIGPALAVTDEACPVPFGTGARVLNYGQEVDITFWQTLPFAVFWGHFVERQMCACILPGSAPHWSALDLFAAAVSLGNALVHSRKVMSQQQGAI